MTTPKIPQRPAPPNRTRSRDSAMTAPPANRMGIRAVLVGVEGVGKTSIGAFGNSPVIIMAPDELGYLTLHSRKLVPECPISRPGSWDELLDTLEALAADLGGAQTIVLDAIAGMESLCAMNVCKRDFDGDWGERGFGAYGRGAKAVMREWPLIFSRLTACAQAGADVLIIGHARVKNFKNPDGPDYDRYECNCGTDDVWSRIKMWADACLFLTFRSVVELPRPEANVAKAHGKAIGHQRIMRCQYSAAADAKNQYGLEPEYEMPNDPRECAAAFWALMRGD